MRITHNILNQTALEGMQTNIRRLAELQKQAVTTKRLTRPEDDPSATEQALGFRARLQNGEAILQNANTSSDWLNATERALSDMNTLLIRVQDATLRGASETLGSDERRSLATEVEGLLEEAVALGNTRHGNHYIFSGFQVNQPAFSPARDISTGLITAVTYNGDSGTLLREVEPGKNMGINVPGSPAFDDLFSTLVDLRDKLKADPFVAGDITTKVQEIQDHATNLLDLQAGVGAKLRRLEATVSRVEAAQLDLQKLLSKAEDANMAEVISQLSQQKFAYETTLAVNAQTLKLSLLDFLK